MFTIESKKMCNSIMYRVLQHATHFKVEKSVNSQGEYHLYKFAQSERDNFEELTEEDRNRFLNMLSIFHKNTVYIYDANPTCGYYTLGYFLVNECGDSDSILTRIGYPPIEQKEQKEQKELKEKEKEQKEQKKTMTTDLKIIEMLVSDGEYKSKYSIESDSDMHVVRVDDRVTFTFTSDGQLYKFKIKSPANINYNEYRLDKMGNTVGFVTYTHGVGDMHVYTVETHNGFIETHITYQSISTGRFHMQTRCVDTQVEIVCHEKIKEKIQQLPPDDPVHQVYRDLEANRIRLPNTWQVLHMTCYFRDFCKIQRDVMQTIRQQIVNRFRKEFDVIKPRATQWTMMDTETTETRHQCRVCFTDTVNQGMWGDSSQVYMCNECAMNIRYGELRPCTGCNSSTRNRLRYDGDEVIACNRKCYNTYMENKPKKTEIRFFCSDGVLTPRLNRYYGPKVKFNQTDPVDADVYIQVVRSLEDLPRAIRNYEANPTKWILVHCEDNIWEITQKVLLSLVRHADHLIRGTNQPLDIPAIITAIIKRMNF